MRDLNLVSHLFEIEHILRKSRFAVFLKMGCSCMFWLKIPNLARITIFQIREKIGSKFIEPSAQKTTKSQG